MQTNPLSTVRAMNPAAHTILPRPAANVAPTAEPTARARGADSVVLSRQAIAQSATAAAQGAKAKAAVSAPPIVPSSTPAIEATQAQASPRSFGQSDLDMIRDLFGLRKGDEGYAQDADADGNGVIDFRDMTHVLANWGQPRP